MTGKKKSILIFIRQFHPAYKNGGPLQSISNMLDLGWENHSFKVITQSVETNTFLNKMSITLGYGSDIIPANGYEYIGVFGGVSFTFFNHLEIMGEYDARNYNIGSRIKLFDSIFLLGGFRDMKYFSGGGGIYFQL